MTGVNPRTKPIVVTEGAKIMPTTLSIFVPENKPEGST